MLNRNNDIVLRNIHDSYFLIDTTQNYLNDICNLYEINEIGKFCWDSLATCVEIEDIVKSLMENLIDEVDYDEVNSDIREYINMLIDNGFVEEV